VIEGKTGLFFREQTADSLAAALQSIGGLQVSPSGLQAYAKTFDVSVFEEKMHSFVEAAVEEHSRVNSGMRVPGHMHFGSPYIMHEVK